VIITIDGPAGSGKSSTAKAVAGQLGFRHLDSGAFYRALTFLALRDGVPVSQWPHLTRTDLEQFRISARPVGTSYHLFTGDTDVSSFIRSPEVNAHVSDMARIPAVREWLLARLREAAFGCDLVADGRDLGTVVFPEADLKFFLVASPSVRARRRLAEGGRINPDTHELSAETARLMRRDTIDSERDVAPLRQPQDAILIDTSELDFREQVARIVELARSRMPT
jgi:cytidylate kinase